VAGVNPLPTRDGFSIGDSNRFRLTYSRATCCAIVTPSSGMISAGRSQTWESRKFSPHPDPPWQRAYVERVIGSIRRECLDHAIVFNETSLRRTLISYFLPALVGSTRYSWLFKSWSKRATKL
jgi:hypothetical protein